MDFQVLEEHEDTTPSLTPGRTSTGDHLLSPGNIFGNLYLLFYNLYRFRSEEYQSLKISKQYSYTSV